MVIEKSTNKYLLTVILVNIFYSTIVLILSNFQNRNWNTGDSAQYENMAIGIEATPPFSYRPLVPYIVGLFPSEIHIWVWISMTIFSMTLTACLLFLLININIKKNLTSFILVLFFIGSRINNYHLNEFALVDPLFFAFSLGIFYLYLKDKFLGFNLMILVTFFVKESFIFYLPLIILDSFSKKEKKYLFSSGIWFIMLSSAVFLRGGASQFNMTSFLDRADHNGIDITNNTINIVIELIELSFINYPLYLFGPIYFFSILAFFNLNLQSKIMYLGLLIEVFLLFVLAADWYRMMFLLFPIVYLSASLLFTENIPKKNDKIYYLSFLFCILVWMFIVPARWIFGLEYVMVYIFIICLFSTIILFFTISKVKTIVRSIIKSYGTGILQHLDGPDFLFPKR